MSFLNWGMIQDGGAFESLMHAILFADDAGTLLFGRPGKDAGQDARSVDGSVIYQAKYRQGLVMDGAVDLALEELEKIKKYRQPQHPNYKHWQHARRWILVANLSTNPNDDAKWQSGVVPGFQQEGLTAEYWHIEELEGKLAAHAHVRDVFFGGENRVLVGLKEAHELLSASCVGSASLEALMVGRDEEIRKIIAFADSGDKRILPVVGPGGIGKSRLLYESLVSLSQNGWRVLWALPGTMARSARWFHLLNGSQRTCVAIDDPDDPGLLRAVIEQLATVEHRNWKVIISCRTEKAEALRVFLSNRWIEQTILLWPLGEPASIQLLNTCLDGQGQECWLHSVYQYTHGVPGWLCLIGELAKRGSLSELPVNADDVSAAYVDSCLQSLGEPRRQQGRTLLRWLALWGALKLDVANEEQPELCFLETQGIPNEAAAHDLLRDLVGTGLVRNWGVGKRIYAVEPLIIREVILSSWLLTGDGEAYQVNSDGTRLVSQLVKGEIPAVDMVLRTLSHLTRSRLDEPEGESFLKPVFDAMLAIARDGSLLDQYHVADFVEKAGVADPENALDVLITIRGCHKENMGVDVSPWGAKTFSHVYLVAKLPWVAFQIAEHVSDYVVARRYLEEFREYVTLESAGEIKSGSGKGARQLLKRLLCESKSAEAFAKPAQDILTEGLDSISAWPFVGLLLESLLKPERSSMEWVSNWKIAFVRRVFRPESSEWNMAANLREMAFNALKSAGAAEIHGRLWHILAESHHDFHRAVLHGNVTGAAVMPYRAVLRDDLTSCAAILQSPPEPLTVELATHAREIWSWYLTYGRPEDPIDLARQCEQLYNNLSRWRLHEFFQFRADEELAPATERIVNMLRAATEPKIYYEFFEEARRYLEAAQRGSRDMANSWRISKLADECADLLSLDTIPLNALSSYVVRVLNEMDDERALDWTFTVRVCQKFILGIKAGGDEVAVRNGLERLLGLTKAKSRLLYGLYSNVHPASTGALVKVELDCVLEHESGFSFREWFVLLGEFALVSWDTVQLRLQGCLEGLRDEPVEATNCMFCFIQSFHLVSIRYGAPSQRPTAWIVEMITHFELDGSLFGYELSDLRDQTGFTLSMSQMVALIRSRMELEQRPKTSDRFEILPYEFEVNSWCKLDETNKAEVIAFNEFCQLALGNGFTALYTMPKYIAQLNPTGHHVASFVEQYILDNPTIDGKGLARLGYLASAYPDDSEAWATIARPICSRAQTLRKDDRRHVFFGLSRKETGVIVSVPGEVAEYYIQARDNAARMLAAEPADSPLRSYREWACLCAEADLLRESGRAEEVANG